MNLADFAARASELIAKADRVLLTGFKDSIGSHWVDTALFAEFRSAGLSFLDRTFGNAHPYYVDFEKYVERAQYGSASMGRGILVAAKDEVAGGWAVRTKGLVAAELFADFLEMAEYLLAEDYKDAAAVMTGGVLEEHLRQLCLRTGVPVTVSTTSGERPKKADAMNHELAQNGVYTKLDLKNVTAWLDIRNKSAHGDYAAYNAEQVRIMWSGVSEFMARVPI